MLEKIKGAIMGGAIGDALGAPVEFYNYKKIIKFYGQKGIQDYEKFQNYPLGAYTDDTQMMIATAMGLLESYDINDLDSTVEKLYEMYLEWFHMQNDDYQNRFAGNTCLEALSSGDYGTINFPINDSKGSGGLMRVVPIGLVYQPEKAFELGMKSAALTHGHATGYLTAGFWAMLISYLKQDKNVEDAIFLTTEHLRKFPEHEETEAYILKSIELYTTKNSFIHSIHLLGKENGGWTAEEILAISLLTILTYTDSYEEGVLASVNHSGDSDTTGLLVGSVLGLINGFNSIPQKWVERIEDSEKLILLSETLSTIDSF